MNENHKELWKSIGMSSAKAVLFALFHGIAFESPRDYEKMVLAVENLFEGKIVPRYSDDQIRRAIRYLKERKLIDVQSQYQKDVFKLTKIGYFRVRKLLKSFGIPRPKKWNGKWHIVIFDVPETKKDERDIFRQQLKSLGLIHLQESIFIHPYECRDQVYYLAGLLFIKPSVRYIVAEEVTGEKDLRRRFYL